MLVSISASGAVAQQSKPADKQALPNRFNSDSRKIAEKTSESLKVEIVEAPTFDKESQEVLDALKNFMEGLEHANLEEIGACLSDNITQINQQSGKVLYGKAEVLENIKKNIIGTNNEHPVKRIVIHRPFIGIKNDTAMVSFRATKELTGKPVELESWCSEVFEHKDGRWLVLQLKTNWKPMH